MPDFIPILIIAILGFMILLIVFGTGFGGFSSKVSDSSRTIDIGEDFVISYSVGEAHVATLDGEVNNGLFSYSELRSDFDVENVGDVTEGTVMLETYNSNYYGNLMIAINGNEIYRGAPNIGDKALSFNGSILNSNNVIEVKTESSGWKIWAPTVYILDTDVSVSYESKKTHTSEFELGNLEVNNVNRGRLLIFGPRNGDGNLIARLNGVEIFYGRTPIYIDFAIDNLKVGKNTLDLSAEANTIYNISSAQIVLFFG